MISCWKEGEKKEKKSGSNQISDKYEFTVKKFTQSNQFQLRESILYWRLFRFDQQNDILWYQAIPVYRIRFTTILYICVCVCVCVCVYYNKYKSLPQKITSIQNKLFMVLDFSINLKKKKNTHNIKNRKLNCSLHTKTTNNANKLMQINKLPFCPYKNSKITTTTKKLFSISAGIA